MPPMCASESDIRPQTHALDALIRQTISQIRDTPHSRGADAMLFLGNWHQAFPALLVQDPVLEPVDKIVWMIICQHGRTAGTCTAFPSYSEIARQTNIASTSTVSRAIAILRATRWLSLCARVRDPGGRFRGNVYALHEEPLPLADAMHLDPKYMAFVKEACSHHHARVRRVAEAVLEAIDEDIRSGVDLLAPQDAIERRLDAVAAVRREGPRRYFCFSAAVLARLGNAGSETHEDHQHQKSKAGAVQNLHPQKSKALRSSSNNNKTTTTTHHESNDSQEPTRLIYSNRLSENQREVAARYLQSIPPPTRQSVLDELEGRLRAVRQGAKPVYDELRYLHRLCAHVRSGRFQANLGLKVLAEREHRASEEARLRQAKEDDRRRREARARQCVGESPLAEARKNLGMPPAERPPARDS